MKKYLIILFAVLSCSVFAANLIENGSFDDIADGKTGKWQNFNPKKLPNVEHSIAANGKNGKAGRISTANTVAGITNFLAFLQNINVAKLDPYTPGAEVVLSFDAKVETAGTNGRVYVEGYANGKGFNFFSPTIVKSDDWKHYEVKYKLPAVKPVRMYIVMQLINRGSIMFDNVKLEVVKSNK